MAMRLSGLISGMDTEAVVKSLMDAHRLKSTKVQNKITTTEWKQDKWKALNSKIYSLYTGQLSRLRMQGSFAVKKATSSNISKLEVTAGSNAPEGIHNIQVKKLASAQFLTGAKLGDNGDGKDINGNVITSNTKLADLGFDVSQGTIIHVKVGKKEEVAFDVRENMTIGDFVNELKNKGLNANYDAGQNRLFISSKASGVDNAFEITSSSSELVNRRNEIRDFVGYDKLSNADKNKIDGYLAEYLNNTLVDDDRKAIEGKMLEFKYTEIRTQYVQDYIENDNNRNNIKDDIESELRSELGLEPDDELDQGLLDARIKDKLTEEGTKKAFEQLEAYKAWASGDATEIDDTNVFKVAADELSEKMNTYKLAAGNEEVGAPEEGLTDILSILKIGASDGAILVEAADSEIIYNRATLTGSSNNFSVNGLNLTLKGVTAEEETISLSVTKNTEAVYDMVKDFVKTYNELLKEMNEAYNAESSRGYDPLTEEERAMMTDDQIDKWENKIKDSLLRRDNTLGSLINVMRTSLSQGVVIDGKSYSLSSF
ncbi:MAG TPA: flagellar filament capping protein FliD, partial [Clostridiales bacterium]|nr:flagellar filament capping protein FliD [Clostridiales bacterium]